MGVKVRKNNAWVALSGGGGGGGGNYESYISSLSGNSEVEFTNIPSWATKITLIGENVLLPQLTTDQVGSLMEFGGSSGYLSSNAYTQGLHYGELKNNNAAFQSGFFEYNDSPYSPFILLYGSSQHVNNPILSQVLITFQKVKGQNKWIYSGSASSRKGNPSTTTVDLKWLNNFTGSFTATEVITKLKFYSYTSSSYTTPGTDYSGGTVTAIYEGEGGGSGGGGGGAVPSKTIVMYHGDIAPSGWVICDNSAAAIAAGAPDLRDKFIVATGSKHSRTSSGGSNNAVVVSHSHTINNHTHSFSTTSDPGNHDHNVDVLAEFASTHGTWQTGGGYRQVHTGGIHRKPITSDAGAHTHSGTTGNPNDRGTDSVGDLATDANLPPYYALTFIMKI